MDIPHWVAVANKLDVGHTQYTVSEYVKEEAILFLNNPAGSDPPGLGHTGSIPVIPA